ncbi:MAG: mannose-1-phosphate guanylyltransferase/mannose-6-phosphate isomerase [Syntrophobacterales bacterium]|jgi:mannose-1-phosphate guanylyltransferase/mannose-6-phosphate isomerase|nr:mannose-1-phosphate guanylyltransferase/mannose-6-phosphate isomerase [Syntrophobacterales bacterium]
MMNMHNNIPIYGVILAGGWGTRFWPLSRSQYPKQVLRLLGSESMLQSTVKRLLPRIPPERLAVVTNASQAELIHQELHRKGWDGVRIWVEPQGRNTAAAVGLAAVTLEEEVREGIMAVFPADHFIRDQASLLRGLDVGANWAQAGCLVTFGIPPTRPETGYGYIKQGAPLDDQGRACRVARFIEKPPLAQAQEFLADGCYSWNSGIFLFRPDVVLDACSRYLPDLCRELDRMRHPENQASLEEIYQRLPSISFDHGILEKAENVVVVPVEMGWNDVGTWEALHDLFPRDGRGNVKEGRVLDQHSQECIFWAQNRLVATIGLENTIVVDTPDATLVCHRDRAQEVKDLVTELHRQQLVESVHHTTVERPWGRYTVTDEGPGFKVKRIVVDSGKKLSLQVHQRRAEHWVVVSGTAQVTVGQELRLVSSNQSVYIPPKTPHRLENPTIEPLQIVEVQTGDYLEEDDIMRLDDDYWHPDKA